MSMKNLKRLVQKIVLGGFGLNTISSIEKLAQTFGVTKDKVCGMYVDIKNDFLKEAFGKAKPEKRLLLLPQCLRKKTCKAKLTNEGYECNGCGACTIPEIKKKAESKGYIVFVVPGGSLVPRLIEKYKPDAILGVACYKELLLGSSLCGEKKIPHQGIPLLSDGCFETTGDTEKIIKNL